MTCFAVCAAMRPKSSFGSSGKISSSPSSTSFFIRRALSIMMCFSGSKRTFPSDSSGSSSISRWFGRLLCSFFSCSIRASSCSSGVSSGLSILSSTTVLSCSKFTVPVSISKADRITCPFFPYSFLYAVASACSIASIIFARLTPRSSSISPNTE